MVRRLAEVRQSLFHLLASRIGGKASTDLQNVDGYDHLQVKHVLPVRKPRKRDEGMH